MFWIITIIVLIANEYAGGEGWNRTAVRNFAVFALISAAAAKDPGGVLVILIITLSAFVGWELYLADCRKRAAARKKSEKEFGSAAA